MTSHSAVSSQRVPLDPPARRPTRAPRRARDWTGERVGRWLGSWAFTAGTLVLVAAATLLTARQDGSSVGVPAVLVAGLVLAELPLLFMAVRHADRTAAELAIHQLETDKLLAAEVRELSDTVARLAVDLARLNARLRADLAITRRDDER